MLFAGCASFEEKAICWEPDSDLVFLGGLYHYDCYDWTGESEVACKRGYGHYETGTTCREFCDKQESADQCNIH